jgi:hypothetical protein
MRDGSELLERVRIEQEHPSVGAVINDYRRVSIEEPEIPDEIEHAVGLLVHQQREDVSERRCFVADRLPPAPRSSRGSAEEAHVIEHTDGLSAATHGEQEDD